MSRRGWASLTDAVLLVPVQPVAGAAEALESPRRVLAGLLAAAVVHAALVHVWGKRPQRVVTGPGVVAPSARARCCGSPPQWASPYMV